MTLLLQSAGSPVFRVGPFKEDGGDVRVHLAITKEDDGTFSVIVLNLPGCGSCGESEEIAISNVREAVKGIVEDFSADGVGVPWLDTTEYGDFSSFAKLKWIMVNV